MSEDNLATRQQIFDCIVAYKRDNDGLSPSIEELAEKCFLSKSTVRYHLMRLEIEGRIRTVGRRAIEVIGGSWDYPDAAE